MPLPLADQQALDRWESLHLDPDYDMAAHRRRPSRCPICGSIETHGSQCRWCHTQKEDAHE